MTFNTASAGASVAALALMLSVVAAPAQQVPQPEVRPEISKAPVAGQILTQPAATILARDLIGQTVYAPDNTKIGSISDLVLTKDGRAVDGFVIGVGGFLGIGERNVALKMEQLKIAPATDGTVKLTANVTKDELSSAPAFKSHKDMESEKRASERPSSGTSTQR
jgi:sporulation protein YlmC with PRC-barrel domain